MWPMSLSLLAPVYPMRTPPGGRLLWGPFGDGQSLHPCNRVPTWHALDVSVSPTIATKTLMKRLVDLSSSSWEISRRKE